MPEIIDILTLPTNKATYIPVNNAVAYVTSLEQAAPDYSLKNGSDSFRFRRGDSFIILSAGFVLPEAFTQWKNIADIDECLAKCWITLKGVTTGLIYNIDTMGANQAIFIPLENFEHGIDVFCDFTKQVSIPAGLAIDEPFYLRMQIAPLKISMAGAPAALNGKSLIIAPFLRVLHNFPMY